MVQLATGFVFITMRAAPGVEFGVMVNCRMARNHADRSIAACWPAMPEHFSHGSRGLGDITMQGFKLTAKTIHVLRVEPGCKAYVLCEIFLAEIDGPPLRRDRVPVDVPGMGKGTVTRLQDC